MEVSTSSASPTTSGDQQMQLSHGITSLTIVMLALALVLNCGALLVFCEIPKLLRSTVNTLVRNLFVLHVFTTLVLGTLVTFDWIAWTHARVEDIDLWYVRKYRGDYAAVCPMLNFIRATFMCATFGILWIMILDRAMTILLPRCPHTMLLKRHPSLATLTVCMLAPVTQAYNLLVPIDEDTAASRWDCIHQLDGLLWKFFSLFMYGGPLLLQTALCVVLMVRLRLAPAKASTRTMNRIVLLVVLLLASYAGCTAPFKVFEVTGLDKSLQRPVEALLLFPVAIHPLVYYGVSANFRKAVRRCFHRRRHLGQRRQYRHGHLGGSRHFTNSGGCWSPPVSRTEMTTTAFSITSEDAVTQNEKETEKQKEDCPERDLEQQQSNLASSQEEDDDVLKTQDQST